jgi:hypothetical protein
MAVWGVDNFFFSGTTNKIETSGTFTENVGFVMGTEYNRGSSFKLLQGTITSDITSAVATGSLDSVSGNPTVSSWNYAADTASRDNGYKKADANGPFNHFNEVKSLWAKNTCSTSTNEYFDFSYCDYFEFLEPKRD